MTNICAEPNCIFKTNSFWPLGVRDSFKPRVCEKCNRELCGRHLMGFYRKHGKAKNNKICSSCKTKSKHKKEALYIKY